VAELKADLHVEFARWVRPAFWTWRILSWPLPNTWRRRVMSKLILKGTKLTWR